MVPGNRGWVLFALILGLFFVAVRGSTVVPLNLGQMSRTAETIFVGTVTSLESRRDTRGHPATFYTFKVEIALKGRIRTGQAFRLKQFGYFQPDLRTGEAFQFYGIPKYRVGERYLLYLSAPSKWGFQSPVGLQQAAFHVLPGGQTVNEFNNVGLFRGISTAKFPRGIQGLALKHRIGPLFLFTLLSVSSKLSNIPFDLDRAKARFAGLVELQSEGSLDERSDPQAGMLNFVDGAPMPWDIPSTINSFPSLTSIPYNIDGDSADPVLGTLTKLQADQLVAAAFGVWAGVTSSSITFSRGADLGVDVTAANFSNFDNQKDGLSPIVYDEDGTLIAATLGAGQECNVLGFAGPEFFNGDEVFWAVIVESSAVLNGLFLDGDNNTDPGEPCNSVWPGGNVEVTVNAFRGVFDHEFGHYFNLDHTQVNGNHTAAFVGGSGEEVFPGVIGVPPLESTNTMFPVLIGHDADTLQFDDVVSVSTQYPDASFLSLGTIEGTLRQIDGVTPFNCGNVIVRNQADPFFTAASNVSGALYFSGFIGFSPENGKYHVPGLPSGGYLVHVELVNPTFTGGSSVGPCDPPVTLPIVPEFYNGAGESTDGSQDNPGETSTVFVSGSTVSGVDILLNNPGWCNSVDDGFESGSFSALPWSTGGDGAWSVVSGTANSGTFSAKAGTIGGNQSSFLEVTLTVETGLICFFRKVSSESGRDFLTFRIDGILQNPAFSSGELGFGQIQVPVSAGSYTFRWEYEKDFSVSDGLDTAWIDDVDFPLAGGGSNPSAAAFLVDNTGKVSADGSYNSATGGFNSGSGADLAEGIRSLELLLPGEVVELDPDHPGQFRKSRGGAVVGVVSTRPGMSLASSSQALLEPLDWALELRPASQDFLELAPSSELPLTLSLTLDDALAYWAAWRPLLALAGRVPVWVTDEGGPIRPGDLLTASLSRMGYATKCALPCAQALGKALEPWDGGAGLIQMLVMRP